MFARAELYKNDSIIKRFYGDESKVADNKIHEFSGSKKTKVEKGQSAYHLKVYQTDGGMGWSSPIWVHGV